jgi:hypothetical protein
MSAVPTETKQTTIGALKSAIEPAVQSLPAVRSGFDNLQSFELMQRGAKLLAASTLVPNEYRGNLANCVIALNMAQRIGADPLLVMQNLYVVHGRPGWSAQFLIACFNQCGRFSALRYKWGGTEGKDDWSCQAYATELSSKEQIFGPVITIGLAKKEEWYGKKGSKWQTIPQLMLMYRAAAWLVRTHAPEISMGLQTAEELGDIYDAKRGKDGSYAVTLDTLRDDVPVGVDVVEGEVVITDPQQPKAEPMPGFDVAKAEKLVRSSKSPKEFNDNVDGIKALLGDAEMPISLYAAIEEVAGSFSGKK